MTRARWEKGQIEVELGKLSETDLFGRFYLKVPGRGKFDGYYASLDAVRPLVSSEQWQSNVTGYYINVADEKFDAVRLSYFTPTPKPVQDVVASFVTKHELQHSQPPELPCACMVSRNYGGEELRFRRFLATYTLIGLEIMQADLLNARCLFATFRWQVMLAGRPYKPHFLKTFESQSPFYRSLLELEKDQFWNDLAYWPNPLQVDWAHLFVNMVLGCDWQDFCPSPRQRLPLPVAEINKKLSEQGFCIPDNWQP